MKSKLLSILLILSIIFSSFGTTLVSAGKDSKKSVNVATDKKSLVVISPQQVNSFDYIVRSNSVLIIEYYNWHTECVPGYAKYFVDLGYDVDIYMSSNVAKGCCFDSIDSAWLNKIRLFTISGSLLNFSNFKNKLNDYRYVLLNTANLYGGQLAKDIENFKCFNNILYVFHHIGNIRLQKFEKELTDNKIITLGDFKQCGKMVNPHFFGDIPVHSKNKVTTFIVVGAADKSRRNYELLFNATKEISCVDGKSLFKVILVGQRVSNWYNKLDNQTKKHIECRGGLSFADMYNEVRNADFMLALLDPCEASHKRYKTDCVTGTAQLIYGFHKIPLINDEFAEFYGLNDTNSIVYYENNLGKAMSLAINMDSEQYDLKQKNMINLSKSIYDKSLENLKILCTSQDKSGYAKKKDAVKPNPNKPDEVKKEVVKPNLNKPAEGKKEAAKPNPNKPTEAKKEAAKPNPNKPIEAKKDPSKPGANKPSEPKKDSVKPSANNPTEAKKEAVKPSSNNPAETKKEAAKPSSNNQVELKKSA